MKNVRVGVVGIGNIGSHHVRYLSGNRIKGAVLTAVCDIDKSRLQWVRESIGDSMECFTSIDDLLEADIVDAVIIAVPHYFHPAYAIKFMKKGLHVMSEKPAGVYAKQVREMNAAADESHVVFGVMFNQRTTPVYQKVRELISAGELGEIRRVNYTVTDSYRSQAYHNSSNWRGTWNKEGGGALINQYAHNLDLWQWICGMPSRIRAFGYFGKRRVIEVEDEVTAYAEYPNGATGMMICSTTEAPGTDRLEIAGDRGKVVVEDMNKLVFYRSQVPEQDFNKSVVSPFAKPEVWSCDIPVDMKNFVYRDGHIKVTQNWINSILHGEELLAPGQEGLRSVDLLNVIYLSAWTDEWVDVPVDAEIYYEKLQEKIATSEFVKPETHKVIMSDMSTTF